MKLVNEVITEVFDKHSFHNSFGTICGKSHEFKDKILKNLFPRFKSKLFATSNMIEQIFNNDNSDIDLKKTDFSVNDKIIQRKDFIKNYKLDFFTEFMKKINRNLKRRNLEPIFTVNKAVNLKEVENKRINTISTSTNRHQPKNDVNNPKENDDNNLQTLNSTKNDCKKNKNIIYYMEHSRLKDIHSFFK